MAGRTLLCRLNDRCRLDRRHGRCDLRTLCRLIGYDAREVPFDLAVVIPVHSGAAYVADSPGLGDALDFVVTDPHTLQSEVAPNIFAIGDAANLPASKAGSVTHFEGEILVENINRFLYG